MASDRDLVSSEPHELNYLLRKWGKKQSLKNREILTTALKTFKDDPLFKPHNRENFYKYVDEKNIKSNLENSIDISPDETGNATQSLNKDNTKPIIAGDKSKQTKKKAPIRLILLIIAIILIILIIVFFLAYCSKCKTQTPQILTTTTTANVKTTTSTIEVKKESTPKYTKESLIKFLARTKPLLFKPNLVTFLEGENQKLTAIIEYLKFYDKLSLVVEGYAASIGKPDREMLLSKKRAKKVASILKERLTGITISIETIGYGSSRPQIQNPTKKEKMFNRRVKITVKSADSK